MSRSLLSGFLPLQAARGIVSHGLNILPPLRRLVMRIGMDAADRAAEPDASWCTVTGVAHAELDAQASICHEESSHPCTHPTKAPAKSNGRSAPAISQLRDLRYRLEYLGLRILIGLVRLFPIDVAGSISAKIWRLIAPYNRRHKRALANLERAFPDKTPEEREGIALRMWENLGRVMVETMNIDRILKEPDRLHVTNGHVIARYKDKMGPVLIVTMHMGNWELGMWPITLAGVKPGGRLPPGQEPLCRPLPARPAPRTSIRAACSAAAAPPARTKAQKTARLIMDYVRQGGRLGFISDLYDAQGIEVPFFGYPAKSMPIAAMIARRVGARIWIGRCMRIGNRACFDVNVNELRIPAHQQSGGRHPQHYRGHPAAFRVLDQGKSRPIHVVKSALVLSFCISLICR